MPQLRSPRRAPATPLLALLALLATACEPPVDPPPPPAKVPVTSEAVSMAPFEPRLTLLGRVEPAARIELRTREEGTLRYPPRFADGLRTGERVRAGERLFSIENPHLELQLTEARLAERSAVAELERARTGVEGGFLPKAELDRRAIDKELATEQLTAALRRTERLVHQAPVSGVLEIGTVSPPGREVGGGTVIGYLATEGAPRIEAWASADDLEHLSPGLRVECRAPRDRQTVGRGVVREVGHQVGALGTVRVVVEIEDDLGVPPPGQGVEVEVLLERREAALTVPLEAVLTQGGGYRAFVLSPSGEASRAEARQLQIGRRSDGRVEVLDGLQEGERVAVRGAELLADGQLVVETSEKPTEGGAGGGARNAR